ncbi:MAG: aldo/keto reductase [Chloroflexi bacterium]|nr:aldo/keto reductase [Chloroflexota bacterium]
MQHVRLGRTGLHVSEICLGTMTFGNQANETTSHAILDTAITHGINFIDTADVYPLGGDLTSVGRTEEIIGTWIKDRSNRHDLVLATKCRGAMGVGPNNEGLSRRHIMAACDASLKRLGTDYIDLYQVHAPDPETPIAETLDALTDLVRAGKVRYIGCSNFAAWQIMQALWTSDQHRLSSFVSLQPRYNMLFRMIEDEILPVARTFGLGVIPYNPLAGGMLTGRYVTQRALTPGTRFQLHGAGELYRKRYWNDVVHELVANLHAYFDARGIALTHAALAWVRNQPGITAPIVGASRPEQLADSLANLDLVLDEEAMQLCNNAWFELPRERDVTVARR